MMVKILYKILPAFCISLMVSNSTFAKPADLNFLRDGISFSLPESWKVIANDSIENNAFYFSAERTGTKATGLISVVWINKVENPKETIMMHQKSMKSANIYRNPGIEFTSVIPEKFAGIEAESCRYTTIVNDQKLDGVIISFNVAQKTVTIFFQSGFNDQKINQKAFALFRQTFNCRE